MSAVRHRECARAPFRFYAELNDHLPPGQRYRTVEQDFFVPASVKDMIEHFGVPHTEVDLILVNGESSDFSRLVQNDDRIAVYPVFESLDITELRPLSADPSRSEILMRSIWKCEGGVRKLAASNQT